MTAVPEPDFIPAPLRPLLVFDISKPQAEMADAIDYFMHDPSGRTLDACVSKIEKEARRIPELNVEAFLTNVRTLLLVDPQRARKLVTCFGSVYPRLWVRITIRLVLWPFRLVWRLLKLGWGWPGHVF